MEIERFDKHPEQVTARDLNNFPGRCPGGFARSSFFDISKVREDFGKLLSTTMRERVSADKYNDYSERRLNNTGQQFFDEIDSAIIECGLKIEDIEKLQSSPTIRQILLPVYHRLREKGYRHWELIS